MENKKEYSCIEKNEKVLVKNIDVEEDFSESLPAYCDDIYRVVKCASHSFISSVSVSSGEILIFGKTEIMLTYYNENSSLCYADFEEEFSKNIAAEDLSDYAFACADICDKYTNFRVINQRRIDVHSSAEIALSVFDKVKYPCMQSCNGAKLNNRLIKSADVIAGNISKIEFDEEFSVPADSDSIKRIISVTANAKLNETKIIKDKVLVKASVDVRLLYTVSDDEEILNVSNTFDVSKIIDQSSIDDGDIMISNVSVGNIFSKAKATTSDKLNIVEVFGEIEVNSVFIRENESSYITDGYLLKRNCECSYSDFKVCKNGRLINDNSVFTLSAEFSNEIKEVKEVGVTLSPPAYRNSKIVAKADILVIYENESDALASMSSTAEIEYDISGNDGAYAAFNLNSVDYTIGSSKRLDLRLNIDINAFCYNEDNIKILSNIDEGEELNDIPSLTICFAKQNDRVWDIAKSFSSDSDLIIKENNLQKDVLDKDRILIIPRV